MSSKWFFGESHSRGRPPRRNHRTAKVRLGAIERLDLALLVEGENHGVVGWVHVQTDPNRPLDPVGFELVAKDAVGAEDCPSANLVAGEAVMETVDEAIRCVLVEKVECPPTRVDGGSHEFGF